MNNHRHIWRTWADSMHKWGISDVIASFLEAAGPLTLLAAQFIYIGKPLVTPGYFNDNLAALADMLEDSRETQAFISLLREESKCEPA